MEVFNYIWFINILRLIYFGYIWIIMSVIKFEIWKTKEKKHHAWRFLWKKSVINVKIRVFMHHAWRGMILILVTRRSCMTMMTIMHDVIMPTRSSCWHDDASFWWCIILLAWSCKMHDHRNKNLVMPNLNNGILL